MTQKIRTCLWFNGQAEAAVELYTSVFRDSRIIDVTRYGKEGPGEPGSVLTIEFEIAGKELIALNGGPEFTFTEAVSLSVDCEDQTEVDDLWAALTASGGQEGPCGWLKDRFGLSWQIVPRRLTELLGDADPAVAGRVTAAMMKMGRLEVATLEAAARGE
ncbi:VOC family protein [Streptomyces sp. NPDC050504]|uniref:VOC family protein n=1 Tax=Streptomyces sp. NPDC050504 TaxID=3365618 RepID=UPI0037AFBE0B